MIWCDFKAPENFLEQLATGYSKQELITYYSYASFLRASSHVIL